MPAYDQGTSIEDIEDQMDDWLEDRKQPKKKVSADMISFYYLLQLVSVFK